MISRWREKAAKAVLKSSENDPRSEETTDYACLKLFSSKDWTEEEKNLLAYERSSSQIYSQVLGENSLVCEFCTR